MLGFNPLDAVVDYYLYPSIPGWQTQTLCPTYNVGGTECLLMTRSDATCWVFYCHGNTTTLSDLYNAKVAQNIAEHCKCNFIAPAYPSTKQKGVKHDQVIHASVKAAYDRIRADQEQPVYVVGRSLGVGVALALAAEHPPAGVACISGFRSVHSLLPCSPLRCLVNNRYDNVKLLESEPLDTVRKLIIHGDSDTLIPKQHGEYLSACTNNSVLHIVPDMDHCPTDYQWQDIITQLQHFVQGTITAGGKSAIAYPLWRC